jgi:hypothetical protein
MTIRIPDIVPDPAPDPENERQREAETIVARTAVATLLSEGSLYSPITVTVRPDERGNLLPSLDLVPSRITRACGLCDGQRTQWERVGDVLSSKTPATPLMLEYRCRNCGRATYMVMLTIRESSAPSRRLRGIPLPTGAVEFVKVGQYPAPEIRIPKPLEKALGPHGFFYRRALTSRHQGYGIGAVAYLRRIVEDTIDTLLGLLRDVLTLEAGNEERVRRLDEAREGHVFDDKVKLAKEIIPPRLYSDGMNPFGLLHDLFSEGLHRRPEEQTLVIADRAIGSLEYLFTQLVAHVDERKAYVERMKRLQGLQGETGS